MNSKQIQNEWFTQSEQKLDYAKLGTSFIVQHG